MPPEQQPGPFAPTALPPATPIELPGRGAIAVRRAGPSDAPPLLLLHGWSTTAAVNWCHAIRPLSARFHVVAPDLRGHGGGLRDGATWTLERCADDMAALVRVLGLPPVIAVGYSMGGAVAQLLWRRHRPRVSGMVLCSSAQRYNTTRAEWLRFAGLLFGSLASRVVPSIVPRTVASMIMRVMYGNSGMQRWINEHVATHSWRHVLDLGVALGRFDSRPWAHEIDVPVASVVTTTDGYVHAHRQRALARASDASVFPVDGDHAVCLSDGGAFAATLLDACLAVQGSLTRTAA